MRMSFLKLPLLATALLWGCLTQALGGGSGLNVAVVVNEASADSVALGNYYCEQRQIPADNLIRIHWTGTNTEWSVADFDSVLLNPLLSTLTEREITSQIDYVFLSMDIPYRVARGGWNTLGTNSTTSAVFYGFKSDDYCFSCLRSCGLPSISANSYRATEAPFREAPPDTASALPFLTMMLTHDTLDACKATVDRGVASDGTFPSNQVLLGKSADGFRNIRYLTFDNAVFNARVTGNSNVIRMDMNYPTTQSGLMGYQNGWSWFKVVTNLYVPGAMADHLTSYGGQIFEEAQWHTNILNWLTSGATASYGTIIEPCAYLEKFPSSQAYFYQGRGFSIAESYYMSLANPYQGLLIGEPLAAPYAAPASGAWSGLTNGSQLSATTNLSLDLMAADSERPLQAVDLFLDGKLLTTLTHIPPSQNNKVPVTVNGTTASYTVPGGASIASVTKGLSDLMNSSSIQNATGVEAFPHGDRIELRSSELGRAGSQISVVASNNIGTASQLTTFIRAADSVFRDTIAYGRRSFIITNAPTASSQLQLTVTKTNGSVVTVSVTNSSGATHPLFVQKLLAAINTDPDLSGPDGVIARDHVNYYRAPEWNPYSEFNIFARRPGWEAAQIQVNLTASSPLIAKPSGVAALEDNLEDLQPRAHLYITAGVTHLELPIPFDTAAHANGHHELTAVVYEGSHVRTQKRIPVNVVFSNSPLAATFTTLLGGSNTAIEATLAFLVEANSDNVSRIELFSTGGLVAEASGISSATLSIPASDLGVGLHPFHALVTAPSGDQYRTDTRWYRIISNEPPLTLILSEPPPELQWTATAGRDYRVLSSTNADGPYTIRQTMTPTNALGTWTETNTQPQQFYQVEASP